MAERSERDAASGTNGRSVPPLAPRFADPVPVVMVCTTLWFLAFCVLLVARWAVGSGSLTWIWTCLAGWVLGVFGYGVIRWQRAAARRGARGAQQGLVP